MHFALVGGIIDATWYLKMSSWRKAWAGGLAERRKMIVDRIDVIEISPSTTIYEDYLLLGCIIIFSLCCSDDMHLACDFNLIWVCSVHCLKLSLSLNQSLMASRVGVCVDSVWIGRDADSFFQNSWEMFKNTFQSGFLSILYSIGSKPLQIWDKKVRNGHIKRITDQDIQVRMAAMSEI